MSGRIYVVGTCQFNIWTISHTHERTKLKQHETALPLALPDFHMLNLTL